MDIVKGPWVLIELKQYEKAIEEYTHLYQEDGNSPHLRNRGKAHLLTKNYAAALEDYKEALAITELNLQNDGDYIFQGICYWYLNQPIQAVEVWRQGLTAPYTDAAGGVELPALLLYASERLGDKQLEKEVLKILKRLWRNHQRRLKRKQARDKITHSDFVYQGLFGWPGAIVPFLLEQIDIEGFERTAGNTTSERLRERRQCQANFYIALRALRAKNVELFQSAMTRCANSQRGILEQEYYLALWELERGFPKEPFVSQSSG